MSPQPASSPDPAWPYEVIHLGGEAAALDTGTVAYSTVAYSPRQPAS